LFALWGARSKRCHPGPRPPRRLAAIAWARAAKSSGIGPARMPMSGPTGGPVATTSSRFVVLSPVGSWRTWALGTADHDDGAGGVVEAVLADRPQ
jgi:hypothetical protein